MTETTFTWEQIIDKICERIIACGGYGLPPKEIVDHARTVVPDLKLSELLAPAFLVSMRCLEEEISSGPPFGYKPTLVGQFVASPSLVKGLANRDLEDWCNHATVLGPVGAHPTCTRKRGLGRGKGSTTRYLELAAERVMYAVFGRAAGLGAEKVRGALEHGIDWIDLPFCVDDKVFKYAVTKPLLELLNAEKLDWDTALAIYYRLSGVQNHRRNVLTPEMERRIVETWYRSDLKQRERQRKQGASPAYVGLAQLAARDVFVFHHYLSDEIRPATYLAGFEGSIAHEAKMVVQALKRVVESDPDEKLHEDMTQLQEDMTLLRRYQLPGYAAEAAPIPCNVGRAGRAQAQLRQPTGSHYIYKYCFSPKDPKITLLQQAVSHLLWLRQNELQETWVQRCYEGKRGGVPCHRYFFRIDQYQVLCDRCTSHKTAGQFDGQPEFEQALAEFRSRPLWTSRTEPKGQPGGKPTDVAAMVNSPKSGK